MTLGSNFGSETDNRLLASFIIPSKADCKIYHYHFFPHNFPFVIPEVSYKLTINSLSTRNGVIDFVTN
jgi:hypothetical protein